MGSQHSTNYDCLILNPQQRRKRDGSILDKELESVHDYLAQNHIPVVTMHDMSRRHRLRKVNFVQVRGKHISQLKPKPKKISSLRSSFLSNLMLFIAVGVGIGVGDISIISFILSLLKVTIEYLATKAASSKFILSLLQFMVFVISIFIPIIVGCGDMNVIPVLLCWIQVVIEICGIFDQFIEWHDSRLQLKVNFLGKIKNKKHIT